ncbi:MULTISPECIES: CDP-alcohol phosphatidyltransferase family protein [Pseudovibrio]|uniref:CDP-alcohol phosphatidyltransferase family protein n=1 Tax=Stappiaceae TaxID=2821832 RepID=UPI002365EE90|nr:MULTISPECIES: CDP-alcohol phosphatidyltransferase family protein [Pseudovibrio]MDD7911145.1 CDP-alcohol phosphatidyltransferase family protein [Pseudovibrio exalbescens]MDX5593167.1 CDP-alcohol phosphatidyltransferase family protein [Pseudovibrio sp. SPO723]
MLDATARRYIDPPLNRLGKMIANAGLSANTVSVIGLLFAGVAALCIALGQFEAALVAIIINRLADGLDGAVARATEKTDLGGFLDIVFDFIFYGAIPFAFVVYDPVGNAVAGAVLLLSFYLNGATFLAFATLAAKRGMNTRAQGIKSFYYLGGLAEGLETIAVFIAFCLFPSLFVYIAWGFACVCFISAIARIFLVKALLEG